MRASAAGMASAVLLGLALSARADEVIFRWVDKAGTIHFTDRLGDVPEPYYSMYAARLREEAEKQAKQKPETPAGPGAPAEAPQAERKPTPPARPAVTPSGPSIVEQELARERYWKGMVAQWRKELEQATQMLEALDRERDEAMANPLLNWTEQVQSTLQELEQRRAQALARIEKARSMLLDEIPKRAHKENVPPRWLQ